MGKNKTHKGEVIFQLLRMPEGGRPATSRSLPHARTCPEGFFPPPPKNSLPEGDKQNLLGTQEQTQVTQHSSQQLPATAKALCPYI